MRALRLAPSVLRRHRWVALGLTLCLVLSLGGSLTYLLPGRAHAATMTVTTCTESALRSAITSAGAGGTVTFGCDGTITLGATLDITNDLTLDGTGHNVTLDGNHSVRVLSVASGVNFTLNHLTIANGLAVGSDGSDGTGGPFNSNGTDGGAGQGGGLYSAEGGTLTLNNCAFTGNTAQGGNGGNGAATAGRGGFGGAADGGGIYSVGGGTLTIADCTLSGNAVRGGNGGTGATGGVLPGGNGGFGGLGLGGGLFVGAGASGNGGTLTLTHCTFTGNIAQGGAGGNGGAGSLSWAGDGWVGGDGSGGGLYVDYGQHTINIINYAFLGNIAQGGVGGNGGDGGNTSGSTPDLSGGCGGNGGGGGFEIGGGVLSLANGTASGNTARGGTGGHGGSDGSDAGGDGGGGGLGQGGGGEYLSTATVINGAFVNNSVQGGAGGPGGVSASGLGGAGGDGGPAQAGGLSSIAGGSISVAESTFADNTAQGGTGGSGGPGDSGTGGPGGAGGDGLGGGLLSHNGGRGAPSNATVTLVNNTLTRNVVQGGAGGAGASAPGGRGGYAGGGGIFAFTDSSYSSEGGYSPNTSVTSSTIASNFAQGGAGGLSMSNNGIDGTSSGKDLYNFAITGPATAVSLRIANSILGGGSGDYCGGGFNIGDGGYNLEGGTDCGFSSANHSLSSTDPKLGPLASNGGPTQTMALLPGSPALNQIPASGANCPATDQRGMSRPQPSGGLCDIGAYEFVPTTTTSLGASPNPSLFQQNVQLCATVAPTPGTPGPPTGSITFKEGTSTLGTAALNGGKGCFTTSSLSLGDHIITASYGGDSSFSASTSATLTLSIQVQGQDVTGGPAGGNGTPPYSRPPAQGQTTSIQNPAANGTGQAQRQQPAANQHARPSGSNVPWLGTGLGLLLVVLGLGGLGGVFYRASRRRPAPDLERR